MVLGSEILPEEEFDAELERAEEETTVDPETGLTLGEVLEQAEEQEIDFLSMEEGETVSFYCYLCQHQNRCGCDKGNLLLLQ